MKTFNEQNYEYITQGKTYVLNGTWYWTVAEISDTVKDKIQQGTKENEFIEDGKKLYRIMRNAYNTNQEQTILVFKER